MQHCIILLCPHVCHAEHENLTYSDAENAPQHWRTWYIIFTLLLGFIFLGLFLLLESRVQKPLLPLAIFKVPQFGRMMLVVGVGFSCFSGFLGFTWSLWYQQVVRATPIQVFSSATIITLDNFILPAAICSWCACKCCCCNDSASC